jgi:hypothetical protein
MSVNTFIQRNPDIAVGLFVIGAELVGYGALVAKYGDEADRLTDKQECVASIGEHALQAPGELVVIDELGGEVTPKCVTLVHEVVTVEYADATQGETAARVTDDNRLVVGEHNVSQSTISEITDDLEARATKAHDNKAERAGLELAKINYLLVSPFCGYATLRFGQKMRRLSKATPAHQEPEGIDDIPPQTRRALPPASREIADMGDLSKASDDVIDRLAQDEQGGGSAGWGALVDKAVTDQRRSDAAVTAQRGPLDDDEPRRFRRRRR